MKSLRELMQEQLPEGGVAVPYGRNLHMEVVEVASGRVWMSVDPATPQDYDSLLETLDHSLRGVGIGVAAMDAALFRYSPGGEGEPVREREIGGRRSARSAAARCSRSCSPSGTVCHCLHEQIYR